MIYLIKSLRATLTSSSRTSLDLADSKGGDLILFETCTLLGSLVKLQGGLWEPNCGVNEDWT